MSSERRKGCTGSTGWQRILFTMASSALCTWVGQEERKYRRRRREATLPAAQVRRPPPICAARACKAARVEVGVVGPVGAWRETAHCGCRRQPPKGLGSHDPARRTNGAERSLRPPLRCGSLRTKALRAPAKPQGLRWASWGRAVRFVKLPTVAADVNRPSARAATTRQRAPLAKSGHFARRSSFVSAQFLESAFGALGEAKVFAMIALSCTVVLGWACKYVPETANHATETNATIDHGEAI